MPNISENIRVYLYLFYHISTLRWCRSFFLMENRVPFKTTFSNGFSWMKMYEFRLTFHWNLFLGVQLTIIQHCFRKWLGAVQVTSHYLNQWWLVYWCIYVSLGLNELTTGLLMAWWCHELGYQQSWYSPISQILIHSAQICPCLWTGASALRTSLENSPNGDKDITCTTL